MIHIFPLFLSFSYPLFFQSFLVSVKKNEDSAVTAFANVNPLYTRYLNKTKLPL